MSTREIRDKLLADLTFSAPEMWYLHIENRLDEAIQSDRERLIDSIKKDVWDGTGTILRDGRGVAYDPAMVMRNAILRILEGA